MNKSILFFLLLVAVSCTQVPAQESDLSSLDTDSDDKVSVVEFKEYVATKLDGFDKLDEFAKRVDANKDGEISEEEFAGRMGILQTLMNSDQEVDNETSIDESKNNDDQKKAETAVRASYNQIKKHLMKNDWEAASKFMTKTTADKEVAGQVISAIGMLGMDIPAGIPGMEDSLDEIDAVIDKYDLDDLEIDANSAMMMQMGEGNSDALDATHKNILDTLDKNGQRWAICNDLNKALATSPFSMNPLTGAVDDISFENGKAIVEIDMAGDSVGGAGNMQVQIMAPPIFYNFAIHQGVWKSEGVNRKKTSEAMKEFAENMPGMEMGEGDSDFGSLKPKGTIEDPSFSGKTMDGKDFALKDMKGRLILVDFWGTWCPPCVAELPQLQKFHKEFEKHGFEVVGVASDDLDTLKDFSKDKLELSWTNVVDADGKISDKFGINAFPTSLLIDQEGNHIATDPSKKKLLNEIVERLKLNKDDYADFLKKEKKTPADSDSKIE